MTSNSIHLVCSSGGVKCFSYIGAIQKLLESGIEIKSISSCSMGSVIGALLASGKDINEIEKLISDFSFSKFNQKKPLYFLNIFRFPFAIYKRPKYAEIFTQLLGKDPLLKDLEIPFSTTALDLRRGHLLEYSSQSHPQMALSEVIKIVTAIPPFNNPYEKDKELLVDAAVASESPVWMTSKFSDDFPIVVLKPDQDPSERYRKKFKDFVMKLFSASAQSHDFYSTQMTSRPLIEIKINCGNLKATDFSIKKSAIKSLIAQGYNTTEEKLNEYGSNFMNYIKINDLNSKKYSDSEIASQKAMDSMKDFQVQSIIRNQVFVSFSSKNMPWLTELQKYMKFINQVTNINIWDSTSIEPGDEWEPKIKRALSLTKVVIFMVSGDFLSSKFIQKEELGYFLEILDKEKIRILWIALDNVSNEENPLNYIQCVNDPKEPLEILSPSKQSEVFMRLCTKVVEAMKM